MGLSVFQYPCLTTSSGASTDYHRRCQSGCVVEIFIWSSERRKAQYVCAHVLGGERGEVFKCAVRTLATKFVQLFSKALEYGL